MSEKITVAKRFVQKLKHRGVRQIYGLPGGGSSLDIMDAARESGIEFILTKTENAAVMMAGALAETTGILGVALMTKGPGVTNATNGVAYASLDRAPVLVITDGFTDEQLVYITHQVFDQAAVLKPLVKMHSRLDGEDPEAEMDALLDRACRAPYGPVHLDLTSQVARRVLQTPQTDILGSLPDVAQQYVTPSAEQIAAFSARLAQARKPIFVLGLEARACEAQIREFLAPYKCAILSTYKAKGVIPDNDPRVVGIFTGGTLEAQAIAAADLMVLIGLDPVELILQPWSYQTPVIEISVCRYPVHYVEPSLALFGSIASTLKQLSLHASPTEQHWDHAELATIRTKAQSQLTYAQVKYGVAPDRIAQLTAEICERRTLQPKFAIDAGAHMFSAAAFFPAAKAGDVLISNGLATMAFALPAAIAAATQDRTLPVLCFTGDGGLMMCMGELCTAIEQQAKVIVIVFNDSALSLIDVKQQNRKLHSQGVRWNQLDFAASMRGLGAPASKVHTQAEFSQALEQALDSAGPYLIDVVVDPSGYPQQLKAMRG